MPALAAHEQCPSEGLRLPVDRTEAFRQCVKEAAEKQGLKQAAMAKVVSALVLPTSLQPEPFTQAAVQALKVIKELQQLIISCRRDYLDAPRMSDADRDSIDQKFALLVKRSRQEIDDLQTHLTEEGAPNPSIVAHRQGMVLILTEHLHVLTKVIDRMHEARMQSLATTEPISGLSRARHRQRLRQRQRRLEIVDTAARGQRGGGDEAARLNDSGASTIRAVGEGGALDAEDHDGRDRATVDGRGRQQQRILEDEEFLAAELQELQQSSQQLESKMLEISKLNHMFSVNVLQQAEQIEQLYNEAVAATVNIERGNKELQKAIGYSSNGRIILVLFFFILPLALLFYDWYDSRKGFLW